MLTPWRSYSTTYGPRTTPDDIIQRQDIYKSYNRDIDPWCVEGNSLFEGSSQSISSWDKSKSIFDKLALQVMLDLNQASSDSKVNSAWFNSIQIYLVQIWTKFELRDMTYFKPNRIWARESLAWNLNR